MNTPRNILPETFCQSLICLLIESIELKIGIAKLYFRFCRLCSYFSKEGTTSCIRDHTNTHSDIFFKQILTTKWPFAGQLLKVHLLLSANQSSIKYCAKTKPSFLFNI